MIDERTAKLLSDAKTEISQILEDNYPGMANAEATHKIKVILMGIQRAVPTFVQEKIVEGEELADLVYSARKHEQYPGGFEKLATRLKFIPDDIHNALEQSGYQPPR